MVQTGSRPGVSLVTVSSPFTQQECGPDKLPAFVIHSAAFARRIYPDGSPTSVVPNKRELHRNIRDGTHAVISAWADGDHPNTDER